MDANVTAEKIDEIVLVGGSTRIPAVQNLVKVLSGGNNNDNNDSDMEPTEKPDPDMHGGGSSAVNPT